MYSRLTRDVPRHVMPRVCSSVESFSTKGAQGAQGSTVHHGKLTVIYVIYIYTRFMSI